MNSKVTLNLCLKVVGIFYALSALNTLPSSISQIILTWDAWRPAVQDDPFKMMLNFKAAALASLCTPLIVFAISLAVILKSEKITSLILKNEDQVSSGGVDLTKILTVSMILLGFFSLLSSIPSISSVLSKYLIMKNNIKLFDDKAKIELAYSALRAILYIFAGVFLLRYSVPITKKVISFAHVDENKA